MTDDKLAVSQEAARRALAMAEVARTGVTKPVNGSAPYSWVTFAGATIRFDQTDFSKYHNGAVVYDAATDKAAAQAQAINDLLMTVATQAASYAFAQARLAGERAGMERAARTVSAWPENVLYNDEPPLFRDGARWASIHAASAILKEAASITRGDV